jgi:ribosomal protein S18 acetylase RimI-like enzyme
MDDLIFRTFTPADVQPVLALQQQYSQVYPNAVIVPGEVYLSPSMHDGEDVICVLKDGQLVAYAPVYVQIIEDGSPELAHTAWAEIKTSPDLAASDLVKDELYRRMLQRVRELTMHFPGRPVQMTFQYYPSEIPAIAYVTARGFAYSDSVFAMRRDLEEEIPVLPAPEGIKLRRWKMASEPEQLCYLCARNQCFPHSPTLLADWQYFLGSPMWAVGTSIAAFDCCELAGNVTVYWDPAEIERYGDKAGYTEFIFVRPRYRGQGIAQAMITEALCYLKENGLEAAKLEVRADNETALELYRRLGYQLVAESRFYSRVLSPAVST